MTTDEAIKKLSEEYPNGTSLYYVDYSDELSPEKQLEIIRSGHCDSIFEDRDDFKTTEQMMSDLFADDDLSDETNDACLEWIRERDISTPMDDLVRNTRSTLCTYDLDFYFEDTYALEDMETQCKEFLDKMHVEYTDDDVAQLMKVRSNASYGGTACLLFNVDLRDFYGDAKDYIDFGKTVKFGIIDHGQGSGDYEEITLSFPLVFEFDRKRVDVDECTKYSIDDIFCAGRDIGGEYKMLDDVSSTVHLEMLNEGVGDTDRENEKRRAKNKRACGCAGADCNHMNMHETTYDNVYPAGWRCKHCSRFWID